MNKNKTILITSFHSFITKNILNTDVFSILSEQKRINIVLVVPITKIDFFKSIYERTNVKIIGFDISSIASIRILKLFSFFSHLLLDSHYLWYKRRERLEANKNISGFLKYSFEVLFTKLFSGIKIIRAIFRKLFIRYGGVDTVYRIFDSFSPDGVFSTDAFDEGDLLFAAEAKRRGILLIDMVRSWDNCYSKGVLRVLPDKMIVNNETIKNEAICNHDVLAGNISVLGSPQHDSFIHDSRTLRAEFFKNIGLDQNKKLIVFAPAGAILSDTDWQLATIFEEAIDSNKFSLPVQFFVRNHPNHPADLSSIAGREDVVIENPGKVFNKKNPKETELTRDDNRHLADVLYYADIVIWVATTLPLDAVIFDKPLIAINFDGYEKRTYYKSVRRYHDEEHMKKMLSCGGVSIAKNKEEIIVSINHYFNEPSLNQEGRDGVVKQQFYKLDGKAGQRIGQFVLSMIN